MTILSVGNNVMVRSVTFFYTGRVASISDKSVVLEDAAWIADTGRWNAALQDGTLDEIEPFVDPVEILLSAIVDVTLWRHALPRAVK